MESKSCLRPVLSVKLILIVLSLLPSDRMAAETNPLVLGPRMSDIQLLECLDATWPGMEAVFAEYQRGNNEVAIERLAEYFLNRETPEYDFEFPATEWWTPLPQKETIQYEQAIAAAERANARVFSNAYARDLTIMGAEHRFQDQIDWVFNPTGLPGSEYAFNPEWTWGINRHPMWRHLALGYRLTRDEKYAREFVEQLNSWLSQCPVPLPREDYRSERYEWTWRPIEAGIRAGWYWPDVYYSFLDSPSFDNRSLIRMVKSFAEHADFLQDHPTDGNHLIMEMNGLFAVAILFPEFNKSRQWGTFALEKLHRAIEEQVYPDGAQYELSPGYHQVSLQNLKSPLQLLAKQKPSAAAPFRDCLQEYESLLAPMFEFEMYAMQPDRGLPPFNDSWETYVNDDLLIAAEYYPEREDFLYVATEGKEGCPPERASKMFPYAGMVFMRSGWDRDASYLAFDAGPYGKGGHHHQDNLSFMIYAFGIPMIVEAGHHQYDASKWRRYVVSARGHNVIQVDGLEQSRSGPEVVAEPVDLKWFSNSDVDYAEGYYGSAQETFGEGCLDLIRQTRRIVFVKPDSWEGSGYWFVMDVVRPKDDSVHLYESLFHIDMEEVSNVNEKNRVVAENRGGTGIQIEAVGKHPLSTVIVTAQEEPVVQGWILDRRPRDHMRPLPTAIFRQTAAGETHFAYVFYPYASEQDPCITKLIEIPETKGKYTGFEVEMSDGRGHLFAFKSPVAESFRLGRHETDAPVVVLMRNRAGEERLIEIDPTRNQ